MLADTGDIIATFNPRLLSTIRDTAEALLMRAAVASDWELEQRCFDQQTEIERLEGQLADARAEVEALLRELAKA